MTGSLHAVVNAIAHIHIKPPRLTKQRFVAGGAATVAVAGGFLLGIRLRFHNHTPQQLAIRLPFHQQAADELGCNLLGGAGEEGLSESWEGLGGYGSGFRDGWRLLADLRKKPLSNGRAKRCRFTHILTSSISVTKLILCQPTGTPGVRQLRINSNGLGVISNRSLVIT